MKITDIVDTLMGLHAQFGDLDCYLDDPDTGWIMKFTNIDIDSRGDVIFESAYGSENEREYV